ncbi:MAG: hypothetical protein SPF26_09010 [Succinivibrio sp.]|nr:hypothetical protein [Succinivibrio sp.]
MKGQNDGLKNEDEIVKHLNSKKFKEINYNQKKFILDLFPSVSDNTTILAEKYNERNAKPDITIEVNKENLSNKKYISIKKGSNNSVHQENIEKFLYFCRQCLGMSDELADSFKLSIYGDGTTTGDADESSRIDVHEIKKTYSKEIEKVQEFLTNNAENLIVRFLIEGANENLQKADVLYHGTVDSGVWCDLTSNAIKYISTDDIESKSLFRVGKLSIQLWNRNPSSKNIDRRHVIQVKWATCKADVEQIHKNELKSLENEEKIRCNKVKGDNSEGFQNQNDIANFINGKPISQLSFSLKLMLKEIFHNCDTVVSAIMNKEEVRNGVKPCLLVKSGNIEKRIKINNGKGNSVHQEHIASFIEYLSSLGASREIIQAFKYVLYGDYSCDNTGRIEDRKNQNQIIADPFYKKHLEIAQSFLNEHKRQLIERFLIDGKKGKELNKRIDFVYHGDPESGCYIPTKCLLELMCNQDIVNSNFLSVGPLNIQLWNRNISGKAEYEKKREQIQVKWANITSFIQSYCASYKYHLERVYRNDGIKAEYDLVFLLNSNKKSNLWTTILKAINKDSNKNIFAVRVTTLAYSKVSNRKVQSKSDIYLINSTKIDQIYLLNNNFLLDEDILKNNPVDYEVIQSSGISCKKPDSKSFTYCKIGVDSFKNIFGKENLYLGAGASLFCQNDYELPKNLDVIKGWKVNNQVLFKKFGFNIQDFSSNISTCKKVKQLCVERIKKIISNPNDDWVAETIFFGKHCFDNQKYEANLLFSEGKMKINSIPSKYSVTTGNGRSKGDFTIVIKP